MKTRRATRLGCERGATLVHVAVGLVSLMGMLAYAVDRGIVWISRGQAQNAADAGALAGAVARAWDDPTPPTAGGMADVSARSVALANLVWGQAAGVDVSWSCPSGVAGRCARVDIYRNGQFSSASLPVIFAPVLGITQQGVRATATAVVRYGNTTECLRPLAIPDRWTDVVMPGEYNHWDSQGNLLLQYDTYGTPGAAWDSDHSDGSSDVGAPFTITSGTDPSSGTTTIRSGWSFPVRLPDGGGYLSGDGAFDDAFTTCVGSPVVVGDVLPVEAGAMSVATANGVGRLISLDPTATFNPATRRVENSCAPTCGPVSPRIVPISVFDVEEFQYNLTHNDWSSCPTTDRCVRVVNILGFFVERMNGANIEGYLMLDGGERIQGLPMPPDGSTFLVKVQLVR